MSEEAKEQRKYELQDYINQVNEVCRQKGGYIVVTSRPVRSRLDYTCVIRR